VSGARVVFIPALHARGECSERPLFRRRGKNTRRALRLFCASVWARALRWRLCKVLRSGAETPRGNLTGPRRVGFDARRPGSAGFRQEPRKQGTLHQFSTAKLCLAPWVMGSSLRADQMVGGMEVTRGDRDDRDPRVAKGIAAHVWAGRTSWSRYGQVCSPMPHVIGGAPREAARCVLGWLSPFC